MARETIIVEGDAKYAIHLCNEGKLIQVDGFKKLRGGGFFRRVLFRSDTDLDIIQYHLAKDTLRRAIAKVQSEFKQEVPA